MVKPEFSPRGQRGFTLVEMLIVTAVIGILATIATLSVVNFMGKGTVESANTELSRAELAIQTCMADAEKEQLDIAAPSNWDGSEGVITDTSSKGVVYDAASYLRGKPFKATYIVTPGGEITGVAEHTWTGARWVDDHWAK